VFGALATSIDVRFENIDVNTAVSNDRHVWQSYCNRAGISAADEREAAIVFLNPDVVIADGGIRTLASLLNRGKRAIQVFSIRVIKDDVVSALRKRFFSGDGVQLIISPRELVTLALANMHPLSQMHLYDAAERDLAPSGLFWNVGSEGLIARCFHLHPMLVYPRIRNASFSTTIDDDYLRAACPDPEDEYIIADSDEFWACELSGTERQSRGLPRNEIDADVASWASVVAKPHHFENFARRIVLHGDRVDETSWSRICAQSDEAVYRILQRVLEIKSGARLEMKL
jgi:hypothetical protein